VEVALVIIAHINVVNMEVSVVTLFYSLVFSVVFVHGIDSLLPNVERVHPYQRGRTSITG
jgi:hypothetical protein